MSRSIGLLAFVAATLFPISSLNAQVAAAVKRPAEARVAGIATRVTPPKRLPDEAIGAFGGAIVSGAGSAMPLPGAAAQSQAMRLLQTPDLRAGESLGLYPSTSGDWIVAGITSADEIAGAVAVFAKREGRWIPAQRIMAPAPQVNDGFGAHTAIAGDLLVISAYGATTAAGTSVGEAHVYRLLDDQWVYEATLAAPNPTPRGGFGHYVELSNGRILIGEAADLSTGGWANNRSIYEFSRTRQGWSLSATVSIPVGLEVPPAAQETARTVGGTRHSGFGNHLDVDSRTLAVGAMGANATLLYTRSENEWVYDTTLTGPDDEDSLFGRALALEDDTLVIGAPSATGATRGSGLVYVYRRVRGAWILEATLGAPEARPGDMFGHWVDIDDGAILVGAYRYTGTAAARSGAGFTYRRVRGQWVMQRSMTPASETAGQGTAYSVDIAGGTAVLSTGDELGTWTGQNPLKPGGIWVTEVE